MAEGRSNQPQHLTSIDLDVSGVFESLRVVNEAVEKGAVEVATKWGSKLNETIKENSDNIFAPFQENRALETTAEQIKSIEKEYSNLSRAAVTANKKGVIKQAITLDESDGSKTVKQFRKINGVLQETTRTQTLNASKLKADNDRNIRQLDSLIEKQQKFNSTVANQKSSAENKRLLQESNELISRMKETRAELDKQGAAFVEDGKKVDNYRAEVKKLSADYERTGTKGESFLKQIGDKARWLSAFYIVNELKNGFVESIQVIKETEDAVVDLQRVLNNDALSNNQISDQLYDTAYQYGRSFEEVSEVATRWAQAGYEWNEVIELTSGTMLALNTAELDVTQSTQGLIAIMRQWGFEVEDYDEVINKINITADNFAVTSETIVDALQRAGSSTKAANMSFEETIGVITALSEATGRSGEHIGVALNALAQYTSKSKSLETFAEIGSDAMKQLVADYNKGAASIYDIWMQLSKELESLSEQQAQALLGGADFDELATELQSALQDAYGTAGTYRRTDFIALLNDIGKAEEAIDNMSNAVGYSEKENKKYMETLTASFNQLKAALHELAVQYGQGTFGLLNILKALVDVSTWSVKAVKNLGGIIPLLTTISGILIIFKAQKISSGLSQIGEAFSNIRDRIKGIKVAADEAAGANTAMISSMSKIGIATTAISLAVSLYNGIKSSIENAKLAARQLADEHIEEAKSIDSLKKEYNDIISLQDNTAEKNEKLAEFKEKLIKQYYNEKDAIQALNGVRAEEIDFLDEEYQKNVRASYVSIRKQYEEAAKAIENAKTAASVSIPTQVDTTFLNDFFDKFQAITYQQGMTNYEIEFGTKNLQEQVDILNEILSLNNLNVSVEYS